MVTFKSEAVVLKLTAPVGGIAVEGGEGHFH